MPNQPAADENSASLKKTDEANEKRVSHYVKRNQEVAGQLAAQMSARGFVSVFQHSKPAMFESQTVWTLWINIGSGEEVLTVVDAQGGHSSSKLIPYTVTDPAAAYGDSNV